MRTDCMAFGTPFLYVQECLAAHHLFIFECFSMTLTQLSILPLSRARRYWAIGGTGAKTLKLKQSRLQLTHVEGDTSSHLLRHG